MAATGGGKKAGKKKKGKTLNLNEFLGQDPSTPFVAPSRNWADESEDPTGDINLEYAPPKPGVDLSKLPSAPRASRGVDIDFSRLPSQPPYTAFLGNLPFDVSEDDIKQLFRGLRVENIRFPQDQGRARGFGYAEFFDLEQLKSALALSNVEKIRNRPIKIDIAGKDGGRDGGMSRDGSRQPYDDKTSGDWRRDDGGGSGFSSNRNERGGFRDDRRGGSDFDRRPPQSAADTDDQWRRDDRPTQPSTNGWGGRDGGRGFEDRGGRFDGRGDRFDRRDGFDRGGYDRRGYGDGRDYRGGGGRFDDGPRGDRFGSGFRDGPPRGGGFRDGPRGGYRDGGFDDYRRNDDRGGQWERGPPPPDRSREPPRERPKLNLQPRKEPEKTEGSEEKKSSSIFGAAKPVDTTTKEKQIEEKLAQQRGRGDERGVPGRDASHDRDRREGFSRDESRDRNRRDGYRRDRNRDYDRDSRRDNYRRDDSRDRDYRRDDDNYRRDNDNYRRRDNSYDRDYRRDDYNRDRRDDYQRDKDRRNGYGRDERRDMDRGDDYSRDRDRGGDYGSPPNRYRSPNRERDNRSPNRSPNYRNNDRYDDRDDGYRRDDRYENDDNDNDNWHDERVRHDRPRVMRPDLVTSADTKERSLSESSDKGRDDMSVLRRGDGDKKNKKDGPIIPPKYEEPAKPVFMQSSKFAALGIEDDDNSGSEDIECP